MSAGSQTIETHYRVVFHTGGVFNHGTNNAEAITQYDRATARGETVKVQTQTITVTTSDWATVRL